VPKYFARSPEIINWFNENREYLYPTEETIDEMIKATGKERKEKSIGLPNKEKHQQHSIGCLEKWHRVKNGMTTIGGSRRRLLGEKYLTSETFRVKYSQ
jgi:hypothetical protein